MPYHSELAKAGPDAASAHARQKDAYRLALAGSRDMKRLWRDFESECPGLARLVAADVQNERREGAEVSRRLDKRLRRAEAVVVTKARKPGKRAKVKVPKSVQKVLKAEVPLPDEAVAYRRIVSAFRDSPVPAVREPARRLW